MKVLVVHPVLRVRVRALHLRVALVMVRHAPVTFAFHRQPWERGEVIVSYTVSSDKANISRQHRYSEQTSVSSSECNELEHYVR